MMHPPTQWRQLPTTDAPAAWQLAGGTAMLTGLEPDGAAPPRAALRWYTMHAPAVIMGTGQPLSHFDLDALHWHGVRLYRRSSGGTAVHTDPQLLMLDVALPPSDPRYLFDVTASYQWFGATWVAALATLGIAARLVTIEEARRDTRALDPHTRMACYGGRSPYEVLADERKLVGLAQVRRKAGALLQAGVYLDWRAADLTRLFALSAAEQAQLTAHLHTRVVGLAELAPPATRATLLSRVQVAFADALHHLYGVTLVADGWTAAEHAALAHAAHTRYAALPL